VAFSHGSYLEIGETESAEGTERGRKETNSQGAKEKQKNRTSSRGSREREAVTLS